MADASDQPTLLKSGLSKLLDSGHFSDLQISCSDGTTYKVHKIILCAQSPFFMNALNPESNFKEAQTNKVPLEHDEPFAVKALIEYFYRSEYTDIDAPINELLLFHVHIYAIGETYGVQGLKKLACDRFETVVAGKTFGELDLPTAIKTIYTTTVGTDKGLREKAVAIARADVKVVVKLKGFREMMDECAQFSKDVALSLIHDPITASRYHCTACHGVVSMELPDGAKQVHCPHCTKSIKRKVWEAEKASDLLVKYRCPQCSKIVGMELRACGTGGFSTCCPCCGVLTSNAVWLENEVLNENQSDEEEEDNGATS
ncbi:hypothetical protein IWX90DRAFT_1527 [Phyllosticta citrichinensis]|uniref:BTB domain-containing protein n=1 Tax=Phyllosticta citrichinensis TaxID=1130410 RepID=A0ABR1Y570_9PEZI